MDAQRINVNVEKTVVTPNRSHKPIQPGNSFGDALYRAQQAAAPEAQGIKFSKHATARLHSREVDLTPEQLKRVENGISAARSKGVSDSLVLVDEFVLVVNTKSSTVVTAMQNGQNGGVFTNINGAVIV